MKLKVIVFSALGVALLASGAIANDVDVYTWTDSNGVPHYTDRPPAGERVTYTGIRSKRTDAANVQARVEQAQENRANASEQREAARDEDDEAAKQRASNLAERASSCEKARERLTSYQTAHRLYRPNADGEREYLSDEEMNTARVNAQKSVEQWCD